MKLILTDRQYHCIIEECLLTEVYSERLITQLISKFSSESPELIRSIIHKFGQIKDSPFVTGKDITRYTWSQLFELVTNYDRNKRIKAGTIKKEKVTDSNLMYDNNHIRVYLAMSKSACVKYGNGYSFCISSRGTDNRFDSYGIKENSTIYFVFNDNVTNSKNRLNGRYDDPEHLLVVRVYNRKVQKYAVSNADNRSNNGVFYTDFETMVQDIPILKDLKGILINRSYEEYGGIEYKLHKIEKKYEDDLKELNDKLSSYFLSNFPANTGRIYNNKFDIKPEGFSVIIYLALKDKSLMRSYKSDSISTVKRVLGPDLTVNNPIIKSEIEKLFSLLVLPGIYSDDDILLNDDDILLNMEGGFDDVSTKNYGVGKKPTLDDFNIVIEHPPIPNEFSDRLKEINGIYKREKFLLTNQQG